MRATSLRAPFSLAVAAGVVMVALGLAGPGRGAVRLQEPGAARVDPKGGERTDRYFRVKGCARCHTQPIEGSESDLVMLKEVPIWRNQDRHAQAYAAILPKSKQMSEILGYDVTTSKECLSCHAPGYHAPSDIPDDDPKAAEEREQLRADGVSCSACHGAFQEWVSLHQPDTGLRGWRELPAEVKQDKYGLMDLRDPFHRTALCVTCHVGDPEQGKVVTHQMYAAGHPPLPSFEVWTFSQQVPRHWYEPSEVPFLKKASAETRAKYHYDPEESPPTKFVVLGAIANLRETMGMLSQEMQVRAKAGDNYVPDFARYDCYACHHELKVNGWRPERGFGWRPGHMFPITPGRVPPPAWPLELVDLAIVAATNDDASTSKLRGDYRDAVKALYAGFNAQQYGQPEKVLASAKALGAWADDVLGRLRQREAETALFGRSTSLRLLRRITELAREDVPDFETTRQLAWAFRGIYEGLDEKPESDAQIGEILGALDEALQLRLYESGSGFDQPSEGKAAPKKPESIEKIVGRRLEVLNDYDPSTVIPLFDRLAQLLPAS